MTTATISASQGFTQSIPHLMPMVYDDLTRLARSQLAREYRPSHTLNPHALVHEAYTKLVNQTDLVPKNRQHLIAIVGYAMRQVIIDQARARKAVKRGGGQADLSLDTDIKAKHVDNDMAFEVQRCLERLQKVSPRLADVVTLRFLAGMTEEETAQALDTSVRTVQRDWVRARSWLREELGDHYPN